MRVFFYVTLVVLPLFLTACRATQNYDDPAGPLFTGNYAETPPDFEGKIKLVSWNIPIADDLAPAIRELQQVERLQNADFLLLQEMDEARADEIARTLGYNYVYYPVSVNLKTGRNFGNAILSRWPLSRPEKILLPYESPTNRQIRAVITAVADVAGRQIALYSVHNETAVLSSSKRLQQTDTIVTQIGEGADIVIAGGDFNAISQVGVAALEERFATVGMERVPTGATVIRLGQGFPADHIFLRGGEIVAGGAWAGTEASDHFPVWVEMLVE